VAVGNYVPVIISVAVTVAAITAVVVIAVKDSKKNKQHTE
jgi:hypothetical protein